VNLLIFGGGELQVSIIQVAKRLGLRTIVIDPDDSAVGKAHADIFEVVEGDDYKRTLKICDKYNVDGIVTAATDKPLEMMARIAENKSFVFPSLNSIQNTINKNKLKKKLLSASLPVAKGTLINKNQSELNILNFPVIIKPIDSSGSRGVIKVSNKSDLKPAIENAFQYTKEQEVLLEEFIEGDEISVEAVVVNKKVHIIQITDKLVTPHPYNVEIGQLQPSKFFDSKGEEIKLLLQKAVEVLGLDNCAIHPELKINDRGIFFIEIGPRLGGDFITSHLVPLSTGVNLEELVIKISLGMKFKFDIQNRRASLIKYFQLPLGKTIRSIDNALHDINDATIYKINLNLQYNDTIKNITNSLDRYGNIIMHGDDIGELRIKSKEIEKTICNNIEFV